MHVLKKQNMDTAFTEGGLTLHRSKTFNLFGANQLFVWIWTATYTVGCAWVKGIEVSAVASPLELELTEQAESVAEN